MGVAGRLSGTVSPFRAEQGTSPETPSRARASSCQAAGEAEGRCGCLLLARGPCAGCGWPDLPLSKVGTSSQLPEAASNLCLPCRLSTCTGGKLPRGPRCRNQPGSLQEQRPGGLPHFPCSGPKEQARKIPASQTKSTACSGPCAQHTADSRAGGEGTWPDAEGLVGLPCPQAEDCVLGEQGDRQPPSKEAVQLGEWS